MPGQKIHVKLAIPMSGKAGKVIPRWDHLDHDSHGWKKLGGLGEIVLQVLFPFFNGKRKQGVREAKPRKKPKSLVNSCPDS